MSGNTSNRVAVVTARARSLPALMCWIDSDTGLKITCRWPPTRPVVEGAPPRYGTRTRFVPVIILKGSQEMFCGVPLPDDPRLILPGLALASARQWGIGVVGTAGCTAT